MATASASAFASVLVQRVLLAASGVVLVGVPTLPILAPKSRFALRIAHVDQWVELPQDDPFVAKVHAIATTAGLKQVEKLQVLLSDQPVGVSLGSNLTSSWNGTCMIIPMKLYDAYFAPQAICQQYEWPNRNEIEFVLAHESTHLAKNHNLISTSLLPVTMLGSVGLIQRLARHQPRHVMMISMACMLGICVGNLMLSWQLEHDADHQAAQMGFVKGGIACFRRQMEENRRLKTLLKTKWITDQGDYLGDTFHPWLSIRARHLERLLDQTKSSAQLV